MKSNNKLMERLIKGLKIMADSDVDTWDDNADVILATIKQELKKKFINV